MKIKLFPFLGGGLVWLLMSGMPHLVGGQVGRQPAPNPAGEWQFAVAGDSRNCGDIIMPTIAQDITRTQAQFYWHLGDLRLISDFDEDIVQRANAKPQRIADYEAGVWDDFIENQIDAFKVPFYVGIGNHETTFPKTRNDFIIQFADWLDAPVLRAQRLRDDPHDHRLKAYFHWIQNGVDFIYLDNATIDQFDEPQLKWFAKTIENAEKNPQVTTIVVGMHEALPDSIVGEHSMGEHPTGSETGRTVYARLLQTQNNARKIVYVLASHAHFFMDGIFNSAYWQAHGGVLPGWIVGTAGAMRGKLPPDVSGAKIAKTNTYGYLLATVNPAGEKPGTIRFEFRELTETAVPAEITTRFGRPLVQQCFTKNSKALP